MEKPSIITYFDQFMESVVTPYRNNIEASIKEQQRNSDIATTVVGDIEYALVSQDKKNKGSVMISHTAVGGYDQSVATAKRFKGYQVIAPSRAGYLRTPLATGNTPEKLADAYAGLLDHLQIEKVVMVGLSAGGMGATMFALRHPDRCVGLILGSAMTEPLPTYVSEVLAPISLANQSDFLNWLISTIGKMTIPIRANDDDTRQILTALLDTNPTSHRWAGYQLDMEQAKSFNPKLEQIQCPTLIIHGTADIIVPTASARRANERIPDTQLLLLQNGQHDSPMQYPKQVEPVIQAFLNQILSLDTTNYDVLLIANTPDASKLARK